MRQCTILIKRPLSLLADHVWTEKDRFSTYSCNTKSLSNYRWYLSGFLSLLTVKMIMNLIFHSLLCLLFVGNQAIATSIPKRACPKCSTPQLANIRHLLLLLPSPLLEVIRWSLRQVRRARRSSWWCSLCARTRNCSGSLQGFEFWGLRSRNSRSSEKYSIPLGPKGRR